MPNELGDCENCGAPLEDLDSLNTVPGKRLCRKCGYINDVEESEPEEGGESDG